MVEAYTSSAVGCWFKLPQVISKVRKQVVLLAFRQKVSMTEIVQGEQASSLVVFLGKAFDKIPPSLLGKKMVAASHLLFAIV